MAAAADPLEVVVGGDPLASPTPRPTLRDAVPVIRGISPGVTLPEGDQGDITPSGGSIYLYEGGQAGRPVRVSLTGRCF